MSEIVQVKPNKCCDTTNIPMTITFINSTLATIYKCYCNRNKIMLNNNLEFLDILTLISFYMQVANYNENISQTDMQEFVKSAVNEIHNHLKSKDNKIDKIIEVLKIN